MKKFALVLAVLFSLLCVAPALSESIDLKSLTDDEIVTLMDDVRAEFFARGIARSGELQPGVYYAGTDIAVGSYNIKTTGDYYSDYYVFENVDEYNEYVSMTSKPDMSVGIIRIRSDETAKIDIREGSVLLIHSYGLYLEEVLNSFAP